MVASCDATKVPFQVIFAPNNRSRQLLPPGHSVLHLSSIVVSYVLRPNSTTCPNAAQNTRLRNLEELPNVKPETHRKAAFHNLADPNTNPTCAANCEGPS